MLRWLDEMSLFEPGGESLRRFLLYPGGIFRFAGTFLTQLLYYPALGAGALILIWLLCAWLTKVAFRFSGGVSAFCFLVPLCLLVSVLHFDEACLTFESQGYVFYNTLGFTFSIAAYSLFTAFRGNKSAQAAVAILLPVLYPLAGYFALLPALMCIVGLCLGRKRERVLFTFMTALISLVLMVVIPLAYYRYFPGTTVDNDYLYLKGLPELTMEGYDWYLWRPFVVASVILMLFVVIRAVTDPKRLDASKFMRWSGVFIFSVGIVCCLAADAKKSEQLRATVLMINAIEDRDWRKASHIMSLTKESPNYTMCVLDNLARAYSGRGRKDLGNMMPAVSDFRHNEPFTITAFVNVPVNHNMGRFNQSHRWATEHNVQNGSRVFFIKYIVRNAIMNGDMEFARKFNRILMRTMFHRRWAEEMNRYIENPSLVKTLPDYDFLMSLRAEEMLRGE